MYMDFLAMYLVGILKKKNYIHELILEPGKGSSLSNLINRTWKNHIFSKECWDAVTEESRGVWLGR